MDTTTPAPAALAATSLERELAMTLHELLERYIDDLSDSDHGGLWSHDETALVRRVRDVLVRAGHDPKLPEFVNIHLDGPITGNPTPP
jgi:hypothetical protein